MRIIKDGKFVESSKVKKPVTAVKPETVADAPVVDDNNEEVSVPAGKTVAELKTFLEENNIEYPSSAKKADLMDLADSVATEEEDDSESV